MKRFRIILAVAVSCLLACAQDLPQFTYNNYAGWVYNNPGIALNASNISGGKIVLYVSSQGQVLTLTSPQFTCQGIDSISATVSWYTRTFNDPEFNLSRTALTMAIDDPFDQPIDSVTCVPTGSGSNHTLSLTLAVPTGVTQARLRFVSWRANVVSSGAIKGAVITAITSTPHDEPLPGDVDQDGRCSIGDVTALINYLLTDDGEGLNLQAADVDGNGAISIGDVTELINILLTSEREIRE